MAQKLWEKNVQVNEEIERFTVGRDREMDLYLAKHDVLGSMAHITMLESIGLLTADELKVLLAELKEIHAIAERGEFVAVRRVFRAGRLHAVIVSGCVRSDAYVAIGYVGGYACMLNETHGVVNGSVCVAIFTCDAATGVWHALVLFSKGGEA